MSDNAKPQDGRLDRAALPNPKTYFVAQGLKLLGRGEWKSACCPFHDDKNPSFQLNVDSGKFKCLSTSCGASGGNVLDFHMRRHDLDFIEAAKALGARKAPSSWACDADNRTPATVVVRPEGRARDDARKIWIKSVPIDGTLGAEYFERRSCAQPPADGDIRFHPRLWCSKVNRYLPAIVCRLDNMGDNSFPNIRQSGRFTHGDFPRRNRTSFACGSIWSTTAARSTTMFCAFDSNLANRLSAHSSRD